MRATPRVCEAKPTDNVAMMGTRAILVDSTMARNEPGFDPDQLTRRRRALGCPLSNLFRNKELAT